MLNLKVTIHTTVVVKHTTIVVAEHTTIVVAERTAEVVAVHTTKEVDRITTEEVIVRITEEGIILVNHIVVVERAVSITSKGQAATEQLLKAVESLQHLHQRV